MGLKPVPDGLASVDETTGGRSPEGVADTDAGARVGPLQPGQRWSVRRKREVALRMLRGEPIDALSRELGVEIYLLEQWREKALSGLDTALKQRNGDPLSAELDNAMKRIGELSMENELLRKRCEKKGPFRGRRSSK